MVSWADEASSQLGQFSTFSMPSPILLFVDADACPVKQEIYRVAERFVRRGTALKVIVVSNSPIAVPRDDFIERVVVSAGMDEADNYITERAGPGSVVVTADVPLAGVFVLQAELFPAYAAERDRHGSAPGRSRPSRPKDVSLETLIDV